MQQSAGFLDVTVIHALKSKTLHCLVISGSCTKFYVVEKRKINYFLNIL